MGSPFLWHSDDNEILLNTRWPRDEREFLTAAASRELARLELRSQVVLASSGSGGGPRKLFFLPKRALLASARAVNSFFDLGPAESWARALPTFHVGGLGLEARAFESGARVFVFERPWSAAEFMNWLRATPARVLSLVPTQLYDLVRGNFRAPCGLRWVFIGGAALEPALRARALELGWNCVSTYGMTETCSMVAVSSDAEDFFRPLSHVEFKTVGGRLAVRGDSLARRLLVPGSASREIVDAEGWYLTQDLAELHERGLRFLGRVGEEIKISGELVSLASLRSLLGEIVEEAGGIPSQFALLALSEPRRGHELVLVSERPEGEAARIRELFDDRVPPYEKIHRVLAGLQIPRTEMGKPLWAELAETAKRAR